jgi:hypothetical protein
MNFNDIFNFIKTNKIILGLILFIFVLSVVCIFLYRKFKNNNKDQSVIQRVPITPPPELTEEQKASAVPLVNFSRGVDVSSTDKNI